MFDPSTRLLGLVQKALVKSQCTKFSFEDFPDLYVDSARAVCATVMHRDDLRAACRLDARRVRVTAMQPAEMIAEIQEVADKAKPKPMAFILWQAALCGSEGRLLAGHRLEEAVHLTAWPHLASMGSLSAETVRLVAFLNRNAASIPSAAKALEFPEAEVIDLVNACDVLALVERRPVEVAVVEVPQASIERQSLFAKIRRRLEALSS